MSQEQASILLQFFFIFKDLDAWGIFPVSK